MSEAHGPWRGERSLSNHPVNERTCVLPILIGGGNEPAGTQKRFLQTVQLPGFLFCTSPGQQFFKDGRMKINNRGAGQVRKQVLVSAVVEPADINGGVKEDLLRAKG